MADRARDRFSPLLRKAYRAWERMRSRCNYKKDISFDHYGGRGIRVCPEWDSFASFLECVGEPPSEKHSLDRINVNGDYEPGNVRWASQYEQSRNRRDTIYAVVDGVPMCLKDAAAAKGMKYNTVKNRIKLRGWSIERAINTPLCPPGRPRPKKSKTCNPPFNR